MTATGHDLMVADRRSVRHGRPRRRHTGYGAWAGTSVHDWRHQDAGLEQRSGLFQLFADLRENLAAEKFDTPEVDGVGHGADVPSG